MIEQKRDEVRRLYPTLSDQELEEVDEWLTRYAALLVQMGERCHNKRKESNGRNGINYLKEVRTGSLGALHPLLRAA